MKTKLFKIAHAIKAQFATFGEALKQAWKIIKLEVRMMAGNVSFKFRKVDGSIREAVGTLTVKYESKGNGKPMPVDSMMYYDTEANGFRSFKVFNLV